MKEFKTVEELVSILQFRGIKTDKDTVKALSRESYYAIVNGYKRPFLNLEAMKKSSEDIYKEGVKFQWLYDLFLFDRDLRATTFRYLTRAEAIVKTAVVYAFCHNHQSENAYLEMSSYCPSDGILVPKSFKGNKKVLYQRNITKLMEILNKKLNVSSKSRPFIRHYVTNHGFVPLWVLANDLTFGNIVNLYQLMQRNDQSEVCTIIAKGKEQDFQSGTLSTRQFLRSVRLLVDFRNLCAHDERPIRDLGWLG